MWLRPRQESILTPLDPEVQEQLKAMDEVIVEYRETLDALSK